MTIQNSPHILQENLKAAKAQTKACKRTANLAHWGYCNLDATDIRASFNFDLVIW